MLGVLNVVTNLKEGNKLLLLFLLAFLVRVIGINYGYWFGDENIGDAAKVLSGKLVPEQHFYPPLLNYITAVSFAILYAVGRLLSFWYDLADFRAQYFSDPTAFYITARLVVVLISSCVAPLFYLIARECGLKGRHAFLVGCLGVLIPGMVLLSHISKSDVPLSVCVILVFYLSLKRLKQPKSFALDVFLGLGVALALSFKQSYIFILFPYFSIFLFCLYQKNKNFSLALKSLSIMVFSAIFFWCIFNVGILLDFSNFLEYQKIQTVMSVRDDKNIVSGVMAWWAIASNAYFGIGALTVCVFLVSPLLFILNKNTDSLSVRFLVLGFWLSLMVGSLIIMYLSGARQQSGLWIPYMTGMQLIAILSLVMMFEASKGVLAVCLKVIASFFLLISLYGVVVVDKQALAKPIVLSVEQHLRQHYDVNKVKILSSFLLRSPQTAYMQKAEYDRHQRVADKYAVTLPERAQEKMMFLDKSNAINYFNMPVAFHGLENSKDTDLEGVMKPYAWPLQQEEWRLDYWLEKNFSVFVLADHEYSLYKSKVSAIRSYHQEIKERCQLSKHFDAVKPLYIEFSATIYECAN